MSKDKRCKACKKKTCNGTNFCNKKCKRLWQRAHPKPKIKVITDVDIFGVAYDSDGNSI